MASSELLINLPKDEYYHLSLPPDMPTLDTSQIPSPNTPWPDGIVTAYGAHPDVLTFRPLGGQSADHVDFSELELVAGQVHEVRPVDLFQSTASPLYREGQLIGQQEYVYSYSNNTTPTEGSPEAALPTSHQRLSLIASKSDPQTTLFKNGLTEIHLVHEISPFGSDEPAGAPEYRQLTYAKLVFDFGDEGLYQIVITEGHILLLSEDGLSITRKLTPDALVLLTGMTGALETNASSSTSLSLTTVDQESMVLELGHNVRPDYFTRLFHDHEPITDNKVEVQWPSAAVTE